MKIEELLIIEISNFDKWVKEIIPVIEKDSKLFYVEPKGCSINTLYIWDYKILNEATNLTILSKIFTYHTFAYLGFFKPTIFEIISQIPKRFLPYVKAFSIEGSDTTNDLRKNWWLTENGMHLAITTLYTYESELS